MDESSAKRVMVTTTDNPYDPFEDFGDWYIYDTLKGYNTTNRLASIVHTSESYSDYENNEEINKGIEELRKTGAITADGDLVAYKRIYKDD